MTKAERQWIDSMHSQVHNGWTIEFKKNVHMYCHDLRASKGARQISIPCEDLPIRDGTVGLWLYELILDEATSRDLMEGLLEWAKASGMKFRIYATRDHFETI
jgi:hypothetical protein